MVVYDLATPGHKQQIIDLIDMQVLAEGLIENQHWEWASFNAQSLHITNVYYLVLSGSDMLFYVPNTMAIYGSK